MPLTSLGSNKPNIRALSSKLTNATGINSYGRKVARFRCKRLKARFYTLPYVSDYLKLPSVVCSIFKVSYRTNSLVCLQYSTGSYCYSPAFHGMRVGSLVT